MKDWKTARNWCRLYGVEHLAAPGDYFELANALKRAYEAGKERPNKVVEDGQAKPKRCKKCFQIHEKRDYCYRIVERPPAT